MGSLPLVEGQIGFASLRRGHWNRDQNEVLPCRLSCFMLSATL